MYKNAKSETLEVFFLLASLLFTFYCISNWDLKGKISLLGRQSGTITAACRDKAGAVLC